MLPGWPFRNAIIDKSHRDDNVSRRLLHDRIATISDVTREANDGRGPVDFKVSRGNADKTLVEFMLARNSHLERNLKNQTAIYAKASDAERAIKVIVYFRAAEKKRVEGILKRLKLAGNRDVVMIDARKDNKPSGSKAK